MCPEYGQAPAENVVGPPILISKPPGSDLESNHLLQGFSTEAYSKLAGFLDPVDVAYGEVLWSPDVPIAAVYFPRTAVCSISTPLSRAPSVESVSVGHEGMLGTAVLLGSGSSHTTAQTHVAGTAIRIPANDFLEWLETTEAAAGAVRLLRRYVQTLLDQTAQSVACSGRHAIRERCARWLLATRDRVGGDEFGLKHEVLAAILGVRRASVTEAAGVLRDEGVIRYSRGRGTIVDEAGLQKASCECYAVVLAQQERLRRSSQR